MTADVHPLVAHLERCLGPIQAGARLSEGVQGVWFQDQPVRGAATFATLGVSHHLLTQPHGPSVRVEFLLACRNEFIEPFRPMSVLADVSDQALALHAAPQRGTVIGPRGRFFPASEMEALYCAQPVYFDDRITRFSGFAEHLLFIWLVPIPRREAHYVQTHGWSQFEARLQEVDPDLLDLTRTPIVDHA